MQNEKKKASKLDMSNMLRHAFISGFEVMGGTITEAIVHWPEYDPESCSAYPRVLASIEAALSAAEPSVAVKALGWITCGDVAFSNTPFGSYEVRPSKSSRFTGDQYELLIPGEKIASAYFANGDLARTAAQADYDARIRSALTAQVQDVAEREPKEIATWEDQQAFEAWAQGQRYEMHQHPLHYLFMDPKTNAARQGWKAALQFIRDRSAAAPAKQEG